MSPNTTFRMQIPGSEGKGRGERERTPSRPAPPPAPPPAAPIHSARPPGASSAGDRRPLTCSRTQRRGARGSRQEPGGRWSGGGRPRGRLPARAGAGAGPAAQAGRVPEQQGGAEPPRALIHAGRRCQPPPRPLARPRSGARPRRAVSRLSGRPWVGTLRAGLSPGQASPTERLERGYTCGGDGGGTADCELRDQEVSGEPAR